ncbi:glycosyltransferase [Lacticaseibacillus chiayiensis]|uniref:glycosyltransferase n=1 Tax=Lacticaseibacillus chiayiensis TaxID=2100821 RepID=UPI0010114839|nr:glycosyltransferase [Lacticaseibacillus chiayiensis]RXT58850.1 glycosyltransferase [Lacticaseibacillus chiayiensis]
MANYIFHFNGSIHPGYPFWDFGAAGKCHLDRETAAEELGFSRIDGFVYNWNTEPIDVLNARMGGLLGGLQRYDCLLVHWPFSPNFNHRWIQTFIDRVHLFGANLIFLVDDMASWRSNPVLPNPAKVNIENYMASLDVSAEVNLLSQGDGFIFHSEAMLKHYREQLQLADKKLTDKVSWYGPSLNMTNYFQGRRHFDQGVDYAGALFKAAFLHELPDNFKLNIYGAREKDKELIKNKNIHLHARVDPEAIPQMLEGSYGLVWDSESYPDVVGPLGQYERYNTPAKFPMYLSANEPVIVWSQAATADFVRKNQIGLVLDSLAELPNAVRDVSEERYNQMITNVMRISPLIRNGFFLKKAILDVMAKIYVRSV